MDSEDAAQLETLEEHQEEAHNTEPQMQDSEGEEDELTTEQALQNLENAWLNEKFAPELLPHVEYCVQLMLEQISYMENNLKKLKTGDIRLTIHTMEISRIRFMISSYLRKRLEKIEDYAIYLLQEDAKRDPDKTFMTRAETRFAREYVANMKNLFTALALQHMPSRIQSFDVDKMSSKPNMDKHVFVRAKETIQGIMIPGSLDEEVNFEEGSQHIICYSAIAHLVRDNKVQLI